MTQQVNQSTLLTRAPLFLLGALLFSPWLWASESSPAKVRILRDFPDAAELKQVIELGLAAKHEEALRVGQLYVEKHKDHPCGHFAMGLVHEWIIEPQFPEPHLGPAIEAFEIAGHLQTKPEMVHDEKTYDTSAGICRGASLMHLARIYYKYNQTLLGARRGIAGGRELERVARLAPDFPDLYAFLGPYHYFTERAPKPAQWVMRLFGLKGDRKKGLEELQTAWEKGSLFKDEAGHILYVVKTQYEGNNVDTKEILDELLVRYPDNLVFQRLQTKALQATAASTVEISK